MYKKCFDSSLSDDSDVEVIIQVWIFCLKKSINMMTKKTFINMQKVNKSQNVFYDNM